MFKKILIAMSSAVLFMSANASFAQPGAYIGFGVGANQGSWSIQDANNVNYGAGSHGVIGTLLAGYALNADRFYLGLEGFITEASNKSGTKRINNGTVSRYVRQTYGYGFGVLPGYMITDGAIVYARGGAVRSHFQVRDTSVGRNVSNAPTQTGVQVGCGVQVAVAPNFDLRGEYAYTSYRSYSNANGRFTPRDNQLGLSLLYRLG